MKQHPDDAWLSEVQSMSEPRPKPAKVVRLLPAEPSEDKIALAFTASHKNDMRFDWDAGCWYQWDGARWAEDGTGSAFHFAREIGRLLGDGKRNMCKASVAAGAERFARADPAHRVRADVWDADPMLLGTPGGTVELRTGKLRPGRQSELITKTTLCSPEVGAPELWLQFLIETTAGDFELINFLRQWCGYALTGDTREHALLFGYGPGGNGKSVFLNTVSRILGSYAATASMDTFTASKNDRHPADLAMLKGARLVTASETEQGGAWAESRIKQMTGGDAVSARFMRQNFFTYTPQFKLTIVGNHAPVLHNVDEAMRRRFNIVPFTNKPAAPDRQLEEKLVAEHGRILQWMIDGCLDWQANGLQRPGVVSAATAEYFDEQDVFGQWLIERCDTSNQRNWNRKSSEGSSVLFADWCNFARTVGAEPGTQTAFSKKLQNRGFRKEKTRTGAVFHGVSLRNDY